MKRYAFAAIFALVAALAFSQQVLKIAADPWMPYTGDGKASKGYLVDVAVAIFEKAGYKVEYTVVPWARALQDTQSGIYTAVAGATTMDGATVALPPTELGHARVSYYVKSGSAWVFSDTKSLEGIRLGVIKGYTYYKELDDYVAANATNPKRIVFAYGVDALQQLLAKLDKGLVDAIVDYDNVVQYTARQLKLDGGIKLAGSSKNVDSVYLGFAPGAPNLKELEKILADGMKRLRESGEFAKILAAYGLKDWK
jgi:polar amino acid transport system substrate-binding protein